MLLPVSPCILVLHVLLCITLAQSQSAVSSVSTVRYQNITWTGEKEGGEQEIWSRMSSDRNPRNTGEISVNVKQRMRVRVSSLREARAFRRSGASQRLQKQSRYPYKKAPQQSKVFTPYPRNRSKSKQSSINLKTTTRQPPAARAKTLLKAEQPTKKYAGVKFPKLDLFPHLRKSFSTSKGSKANTTSHDKKKSSLDRSRKLCLS